MTGRSVPALLGIMFLAVLAAGFLAPYDPLAQNRDDPFAPPTRLRFVDSRGRLHLRPFVYGSSQSRDISYPVRFFVRGDRYRIAGVFASDLHLFGTEGAVRIFLLGSDAYGRDVFSRFLHGGQ